MVKIICIHMQSYTKKSETFCFAFHFVGPPGLEPAPITIGALIMRFNLIKKNEKAKQIASLLILVGPPGLEPGTL